MFFVPCSLWEHLLRHDDDSINLYGEVGQVRLHGSTHRIRLREETLINLVERGEVAHVAQEDAHPYHIGHRRARAFDQCLDVLKSLDAARKAGTISEAQYQERLVRLDA